MNSIFCNKLVYIFACAGAIAFPIAFLLAVTETLKEYSFVYGLPILLILLAVIAAVASDICKRFEKKSKVA